jgi:SAM-dependent methyltransferase
LAASYQTEALLMTAKPATGKLEDTRLQRLGSVLLTSLDSAQPSGRTLLLGHPDLPLPETGSRTPALTISITLGNAGSPGRLSCRSESLPFQDDSFDHVLLHHAFAGGASPELDESCRVLRPGGHLLILGLNRWGLRYQLGHRFDAMPGLSVLQVCKQLRQRNFLLENCTGAGLAGLAWPGPWRQQWQGLTLPVADLVLIVARHHEEKVIGTPLRFVQPKVAAARSTAMEAYNRQAAA